MTSFNIIVATCRNSPIFGEGGIGYKGELPWPRINKDMAFFKKATTNSKNNVVIMGKNTWNSLPDQYKPLPDRINVVISTTMTQSEINLYESDNVLLFDNFDKALNHFNEDDNIWVIGGAKLYQNTISHEKCKFVYITKIYNRYLCDTHFTSSLTENNFKEIFRSENLYQDEVQFKFCIYKNNNNIMDSIFPYIEYTNTIKTSAFTDFQSIKQENQYLELMQDILTNGKSRIDRTNTGIISVFGRQLRFDIRKEFPILTTKRIYWKGVVEELIWFLKGNTNINHLIEKNVHIWDGNSTREYLDSINLLDREERDAGPIYGFQWRHFGAEYTNMHANYQDKGIDQVKDCINLIKNNPTSRRIIMSAWNPQAMKDMCLPPCHVMYQFYVNEDDEVSCHMYQRSADVFLGLPFNIASTALLTNIMANLTDKKPGEIIISLGDTHIYNNHIQQCNTQLDRKPRPLPKLNINKKLDLDTLHFDDFQLNDYSPYPSIKAQMAV